MSSVELSNGVAAMATFDSLARVGRRVFDPRKQSNIYGALQEG